MDYTVSALAIATHPLQMAIAAIALFYATLAILQTNRKEPRK